jgi:ATP-dependent 26S proteasome regulatory subunit
MFSHTLAQEEYIKDEMKNLKRELIRAKQEITRIQSVPLVIGQFNEMIDTNYGIVSSTAGSNYYVRILSTLDREALKPNASVALHRHSHSVVDILPPESDSTISLMQEKPDVSYSDIGGMDIQKQEMREAVELPLTQARARVRSRGASACAHARPPRPPPPRSSSSTGRSGSTRRAACSCTVRRARARR